MFSIFEINSHSALVVELHFVVGVWLIVATMLIVTLLDVATIAPTATSTAHKRNSINVIANDARSWCATISLSCRPTSIKRRCALRFNAIWQSCTLFTKFYFIISHVILTILETDIIFAVA